MFKCPRTLIKYKTTVETVLSSNYGRFYQWLLNTGWPLNTGLQKIPTPTENTVGIFSDYGSSSTGKNKT